MNTTNKTFDFQRIEQAINYIRTHFKEQPSLDDIAAAVNLSPQHFQRLFSKWAGISPKKFLQYTTIEYAKEQLKEQKKQHTFHSFSIAKTEDTKNFKLISLKIYKFRLCLNQNPLKHQMIM